MLSEHLFNYNTTKEAETIVIKPMQKKSNCGNNWSRKASPGRPCGTRGKYPGLRAQPPPSKVSVLHHQRACESVVPRCTIVPLLFHYMQYQMYNRTGKSCVCTQRLLPRLCTPPHLQVQTKEAANDIALVLISSLNAPQMRKKRIVGIVRNFNISAMTWEGRMHACIRKFG